MDAHDDTDDRLVLGLIDVLDLIAPGARAHEWTELPSAGSRVHEVAVTMPSGARTSIVVIRYDEATPRDEALSVGATLERLRRGPVPAPEVLWLDPDGVVFGVASTALTRVAGTIGPGPDPKAWAASVAARLADIHLFPGELLDHLPVVASAPDLLARIADAAPWLPRHDVVGPVVRARAEAVAFLESRLVHGRIDPGALLASDSRITGVVGWRGAMRSDPRIDVGAAHALAWLYADEATAQALLDTYRDRTGRGLEHLAWFGLVALHGSLGEQLAARDRLARFDDYLDWALSETQGRA